MPMGGDPQLVGTTIAGRYQLVRLLGDGGMGAVFKAADQVLRRFVAIKLLHPSVARNPSAVERFQREARAAAAVGHPNIIDILDFGVENDRPYMAMEYLRGRSLSQVIGAEGALPIARACAIATHTLAGLASAHDRGILHRDLKPANLMLIARLGDRSFVKVCDFGFAALFGEGSAEDARALTPERTLVGTPAYAAPERLRGDSRRDPRTDVYSVGVVLHEMLAGQRPFDAPTFAELSKKVRHSPPPRLGQLRSDVPEALEHVVAKALSKSPDERWSSAEEFAAALVPFGGRTIDPEDDIPSDSFAFEMMRIKARDTRRRAVRPEADLAVPDGSTDDWAAETRRRPAAPGPAALSPALLSPVASTPRIAAPIGAGLSPAPADRTLRTAPLNDTGSLRPAPTGTALRIPFDGPWLDARGAPPSSSTSLSVERDFEADTTPAGRAVAPNAAEAPREAASVARTLRGPGRIQGRIVLSVLRFVARRFGERAVMDVLNALPEPGRRAFEAGIDPEGWVDLDTLHALVEVIDARLGQDDLHMVLECGRAAAEGAFDLMRRVRPPSPPPELLIAEMPSVLHTLCQGLEVQVRRLGKGYGRLELVEHGGATLTTSVLTLGFLQRSLQRFGAEDVEVNLLGTRALDDEQTLIELSWLG